MTQITSQQGPVAYPRPQPDIYTLLLIVAILALGATVGVVLWNLLTVYNLPFEAIFKPLQDTLVG